MRRRGAFSCLAMRTKAAALWDAGEAREPLAKKTTTVAEAKTTNPARFLARDCTMLAALMMYR